MKKQIAAVSALAMVVAALAAGAAQAQAPSQTLTMTAYPEAVAVGEPVTFTITKNNVLPSDREWRVRQFLPTGLEFVSATPSQGVCALYSVEELGIPPQDVNGSGVVQCDLGIIPSGGTATIYVAATPTVEGEITSYAADIGESLAPATVVVTPAPAVE